MLLLSSINLPFSLPKLWTSTSSSPCFLVIWLEKTLEKSATFSGFIWHPLPIISCLFELVMSVGYSRQKYLWKQSGVFYCLRNHLLFSLSRLFLSTSCIFLVNQSPWNQISLLPSKPIVCNLKCVFDHGILLKVPWKLLQAFKCCIMTREESPSPGICHHDQCT